MTESTHGPSPWATPTPSDSASESGFPTPLHLPPAPPTAWVPPAAWGPPAPGWGPPPSAKSGSVGWIIGAVVVAVVAIPVVLILAVTMLGTTSQAKFEQVGSRIDSGPNGSYDPNGGFNPEPPGAASRIELPELGPLTETVEAEGVAPFSMMLPEGWVMRADWHDKLVHVQPGSAGDAEVVQMIDRQVAYFIFSGPNGEGIYATWMPRVLAPEDFAQRFFPTSSPIPGKQILEIQTSDGSGVLVDEGADNRAFLLTETFDGILLLRLEDMPIASAKRVIASVAVP